MDSSLFEWSRENLAEEGVITGCAKNHEHLLPWWWMNFRLSNQLPVAFVDFGDMSDKAKAWCCKRGKLISLKIPTEEWVTKREDVPEHFVYRWELHQNIDTWKARLEWFKKPFACLQTPFKKTIWIDIDCQVRQSVQIIFSYAENSLGLALVKEPAEIIEDHFKGGGLLPGEMEYNTGVIPFRKGNEIIPKWAKMCTENNEVLRGDQEVLSRLIFNEKVEVPVLAPIYNWRFHKSPLDHSKVIVHWLGSGKKGIALQMEVLAKACYMDLSL